LDKSASPNEQPSLFSSVLIAAVAAGLAVLIRDPPKRVASDKPFGRSQSRREPLSIQLERALEPGRGRRAVTPLDIPWKGWKDILRRTASQASEDRVSAIAAGVVFFAVLALFPAITALVSCYGLFAKPDTIP
jgi:membrane protein